MDIFEKFNESFRKELPIRGDILEREKKFQSQDKNRLQWILDTTYLCEGDLNDLKKHPKFDARAQGIDFIITHYESRDREKPAKKVIVQVKGDTQNPIHILSAENKLKYDLHTRGCNAGVFYRRRQEGEYIVAEATPARITGE